MSADSPTNEEVLVAARNRDGGTRGDVAGTRRACVHGAALVRGGGCDRQQGQVRLDGPARAFERVPQAGHRCADSEEATFCRNALELLPAVWRSVVSEGAGPTTNHAQRVLRRGVLWRENALGSPGEA